MKLADISNWCHSLSERAVAKLFKNKAKRTSSVISTSNVAGASGVAAEKSLATEEQTPRSNSSQKTQKNLKTQKTFIHRIIEPIALVLAGVLFFSYPVASTLWNNHVSKQISIDYDKVSYNQAAGVRESILRSARKYNARRKKFFTADPYDGSDNYKKTVDYKSYIKQLDEPMGIMGIIKIPKIGVKLPIYHGTSRDVLARGAGHLYGTDLPVGGKNRHTVITAHTGLPTATMFDGLIDMKRGDYFYIDVQGDTMRYRVFRISVVDPQDISLLQREPGRDLATLLTCTPYGVNSHRLLVTGYRVLPDPAHAPEDHLQWPLWMTLFVAAMILSLLIISIMVTGYLQKRKNKSDLRGKHIMLDDIPSRLAARAK